MSGPVSVVAWMARGIGVIGLVVALSIPVRAETLVVSHGTPSIQVSSDLWPCMERMLDASATFRQQFQRVLDTPRLILVARFDATLSAGSFRARSSIRRYNSGLLIVSMEIGPGHSQVEMIAHEFEHVLEQIDGLDLRRDAKRGQGAWYSRGLMIETDRAVRAGRVVRDELRQPR